MKMVLAILLWKTLLHYCLYYIEVIIGFSKKLKRNSFLSLIISENISCNTLRDPPCIIARCFNACYQFYQQLSFVLYLFNMSIFTIYILSTSCSFEECISYLSLFFLIINNLFQQCFY